MLRVEEAVYELLSSDAAVTAMIGGRITAGVLPQSVIYPAIAYRIAGEESFAGLDASHGLRRSEVRVFCCAKSKYGTAAELAEVVRLALTDYRGTVDDGASPLNTLTIQNIFAEGGIDAYDDRTGTWQMIRDFSVWSHEEIPTHA